MGEVHLEQPSPVRFARVEGAAIAYQSWGAGAARVVVVPPLAQNVELAWERPEYRRVFSRLGRFATVLHFDKRGTGASDRTPHMPTVDERVEDLLAVMDAAGIDRAHLLGLSEGGPVAIALAATYPRRVETLALFGSGARIVGDLTDEERATRRHLVEVFRAAWGTESSLTLDVFAPTAAADPEYRAWEPRYERQSATPGALAEILDMVEVVDVRPLLGAVSVPTLLLHRRDDPVVPVALARETAALISGARLVEVAGSDHMAQVGDVDDWLDHYERFVVGSVGPPSSLTARPHVRMCTMGGFRVEVDGRPVAVGEWGSRQARLVCKRLAVSVRRPVTRDELTDMLWPDEVDAARCGARLSVVLSGIRRVLGGGLLADRDAVRLDLDVVDLDLVALDDAHAAGDDLGVVAAHAGPVLPEDPYEDWAATARERLTAVVLGARLRLGGAAVDAARWDEAVAHAAAALDLDPYAERAHEVMVRSLLAAGRRGDARVASDRYHQRMTELDVPGRDLMAAGSGP